MSHVFISYSKKNRPYARRLADHLLQQGFRVWIDERIEYGENWWKEIVTAIQTCAACVVIMTPESEASRWVEREVALAEHYRKPLFPLLLAGENWPLFVLTQYADVRNEQLPETVFFDRLAEIAPRQAGGGVDVTRTLEIETAAPLQPYKDTSRQPSRFFLPLAAAGAAVLVLGALLILNAAGVFRPSEPPPPSAAANTPDSTLSRTPTPAPTTSTDTNARPRPLLPGDRLLSVEGDDFGIVGPLVRGSDGQRYFVTMFHPPGTVVFQPGANQGENARVGEAVASPGASPLAQLLGLVRLDDQVQLASLLPNMQPLQDLRIPVIGTQAQVVSRGDTENLGMVESVNVSTQIGLGGGEILDLSNTITSSRISQAGDQGGLVTDEQGAVVGVIIGGNSEISVIAPIADVLQVFDVELIEQPTDCPPTPDAALETICEDAVYAVVFLNDLFGANRTLPPIVLMADDAYSSYWDGASYYAPAAVQYLPDVVYQQMTYPYINDVVALRNWGQTGSIAYSYSAVLASVIRQKRLGQTAATADWVLAPKGVAWVTGENLARTTDLSPLFSLKAPGTAYDNPIIGRDSQIAHINDLVETTADNGGVHQNGGIPNKAFYETAVQIGSDRALTIWYLALFRLETDADFQHLAEATAASAAAVFGADSDEQRAVVSAWRKVGITVT